MIDKGNNERKDKINMNSEESEARITMEYFLFFKSTLPMIDIISMYAYYY